MTWSKLLWDNTHMEKIPTRKLKKPMKNPYLTPIIVGFVCFALALTDLLTHCPDQVYNWHRCLTYGWIGTIGVIVCIGWIFAEGLGLIKRK